MFDITNIESFTSAKEWHDQIRRDEWKTARAVFVGSKSDSKESERKVSSYLAETFAQNKGIQYLEISSFTGHNIPALFNTVMNKEATKEPQEENPNTQSKPQSRRGNGGCFIS